MTRFLRKILDLKSKIAVNYVAFGFAIRKKTTLLGSLNLFIKEKLKSQKNSSNS